MDLQGNPLWPDASEDLEWQSATGTSVTSALPAGPVTEGHIPVEVVSAERSRNEPRLEPAQLSAIWFVRSWLSARVLFYIN